jgi:hypothetical protein
VRQKLTESGAKVDQVRHELLAKDQEIESKAQADLLAVKQSLDHVADDIRSSRLDGLRSDFVASALVVVGVALATLGGIGLMFWT